MATMYIDRKGADLSHDRSRLWIRVSNEKQSVLIRHIDRIVVSAGCTLDSRTLLMLNNHKIPVVIINPRDNSVTWCGGWHHGNTARRIAQYSILQDEVLCGELAGKLVKLKLMQQRRFLLSLMPFYPAKRKYLFSAGKKIAKLIQGIDSPPVAELRGLEGSGSRIYFNAYHRLFPERFGFVGRNRRPPQDPVNACLSLSYTLLMSDALRALYTHGLDPSLGFYHLPAYSRQSLACDLVEIARVQADRKVLDIFRSKRLDMKHFVDRDDGVFLNKEGRARYYSYWEEHSFPIRRRLNKVAASWALYANTKYDHK